MGKHNLAMYFFDSTTVEQDYEKIPSEFKQKKLKIHRNHEKKRVTKIQKSKSCKTNLSKWERSDKMSGVISMKMFLEKYLGITGESLKQLQNCTHKELDKMQFAEVKRVPFDVVNGSSEFFWVIDSRGEKIPYENPLEKISDFVDRDGNIIPYHNLSSTKMSKDEYEVEYEDVFEFDVEENIDEEYCFTKKLK